MKRLLYVEDDEALAYITQKSLADHGYTVEHAISIEGAIKLIASSRFDCALLDLKIDNDSSLQLIEPLAKLGTQIVMLSGYGSIRTTVTAMKLGAINFLSKPSSINEIIAALENKDEATEISTTEIISPSLKHQEWELIQQALADNDGNISATARQLKMHRRTLQRKLQKRQTAADL